MTIGSSWNNDFVRIRSWCAPRPMRPCKRLKQDKWADGLHSYPLTPRTVHLCVDMQRIFSSEGIWATPWMDRVLPVVTELAGRYPGRTVFTRFITPNRPDDMAGMWQRYYTR